jgi:beta-lactamase regulating signal transducer with metallopeptidase domain
MIALWMAYASITGVLVALLCSLIEHAARAAGLATRGIWAAGMAVMLLMGGVAAAPHAIVPRAAASGAAPRAAASGPPADMRLVPGARRGPGRLLDGLRARVGVVGRALDARISAAAARLSSWDRPLLVLWLLASAMLVGGVLRAALEWRRLRRGFQSREVAGTPVLVTESMGPSAVGMRDAAILLPRWALELEDGLLALVVRHEREHLRARDPLLLLATLLGAALLPWHLPLWWCWWRLRLAIEVDCDARVLRAHPGVRRYAQLLLLTAQRTAALPWRDRPLMSVVAPLRPYASHLTRRIVVMTQSRTVHSPKRIVLSVLAACAVASAVLLLPTPRLRAAQQPVGGPRALVHLTHLGLHDVGASLTVLIYTSGGGRVGVGADTVAKVLLDTLRLDHLPAMTADVTDGDVHLQLVGRGEIEVAGDVTGGPASRVSARGPHITLLKGGVGVTLK